VQAVEKHGRHDSPQSTVGVAREPSASVAEAVGYFPEDPLAARIYPWLGFRLAVIGDVQ